MPPNLPDGPAFQELCGFRIPIAPRDGVCCSSCRFSWRQVG